MSEPESIEPVRRRGIYLLPNSLTTAGLFSGFYAIIAATQSKFEIAAIAIFIAMICDALDGRVARMTNTQSAFGVQYDSLSDMVCFGITPALVAYTWGLYDLGKVGWLAAFLYAASTALRLARFNVQTENPNQDRNFFIGLPCPAAAAVIAGMVWVGTDFNVSAKQHSVVLALTTASLGLLMVSNARYYSFKEIDLKGNVPFFSVLLVMMVYILVSWDPPKILFSVFLLYALSGPALWIKDLFKAAPESSQAKHIEPSDSSVTQLRNQNQNKQ